MSKPRYDWWSYMKAISRKYYARKGKELHGMEEKEQSAVEAAIDHTIGQANGKERVEVIEMVLLKGTHTLQGAAQAVHYSERTARRWHTDFIKLVAKNYGLMDESWP